MTSDFPIWKSVILGKCMDIAAYRADFKAGGYRSSRYARQILAKTPIAETKTVVDLVLLDVGEMGFPYEATTTEIYAWADKRGFKKCPAEVGPALRMQYNTQSIDGLIMVGMEPIVKSDGRLYVFRVDGGGGSHELWLGVDEVYPTKRWHSSWVWVFVHPRPNQ